MFVNSTVIGVEADSKACLNTGWGYVRVRIEVKIRNSFIPMAMVRIWVNVVVKVTVRLGIWLVLCLG